MKARHSSTTRAGRKKARKRFYVDLDMCGGELFLEDFDLAGFCQVLQSLAPGVEIRPAPRGHGRVRNSVPSLVSQETFEAALEQYVHR